MILCYLSGRHITQFHSNTFTYLFNDIIILFHIIKNFLNYIHRIMLHIKILIIISNIASLAVLYTRTRLLVNISNIALIVGVACITFLRFFN